MCSTSEPPEHLVAFLRARLSEEDFELLIEKYSNRSWWIPEGGAGLTAEARRQRNCQIQGLWEYYRHDVGLTYADTCRAIAALMNLSEKSIELIVSRGKNHLP